MAWAVVTSRTRASRTALILLAAWSIAVAGALAATLYSLSTDEFDGLNNMLQIPFALPWFVLPVPAATGWSYEAMAWVDAGIGWLNGLIIASWIEYRRRRA